MNVGMGSFRILVVVGAGLWVAGCAGGTDDADTSVQSAEEAASASVHLEIDVAGPAHPPGYREDTEGGDNLGIDIRTDFGYFGYLQNGDYLQVADLRHDSQSVAAHWEVRGSDGHLIRQGLCRNGQGAMSLLWCNKNFPEGQSLHVRIGLCDGSFHSCDKLWHYYAWSTWHNGST